MAIFKRAEKSYWGKNAFHFLQSLPVVAYSSSPLLSLVTSTSEISHQPVHTYTTYIWQRGRQNRKTGNGRKIQHYMRRERRKKKLTPRLCSIEEYSVRTEKTPQHKSTYTINTWLCNRGKHIQLWQAAIRSSSHLFRRRSQTRLDSLAVQSGRRQLVGGGE